MYPLVITMLFLSLLGILTSAEVKTYVDKRIEHQIFEGHIEAKHELQRAQERARFTEATPEVAASTVGEKNDTPITKPNPTPPQKREGPPVPLDINLGRPPNNSRLNFALVLDDHRVTKWDEKYAPRKLAKKLIITLYGDQPFFYTVPNAADKILSKLLEKKEQTTDFTYPDQLATINLDNIDLQRIFYKMMKGDNGSPPLLNYLTFDHPKKGNWTANHHKLNLMYANKTLLNLIIENDRVTESLLEMRGEIWKEILKQEQIRLKMTKKEGLTRTQITKRLKESFYDLVESYGLDAKELKKHFSFELGHPGNTLLVWDEQTGLMIREKL